jgi:hypothetical protein
MNKVLKNGLGLLLLGVVAYNSVYFKKLDEVIDNDTTIWKLLLK